MTINNVFENPEPEIEFEPDVSPDFIKKTDHEDRKIRQANAYIRSAKETILMIAVTEFLHDEFKAGPDKEERSWSDISTAERAAYITSATERYASTIANGAAEEPKPLVEEEERDAEAGES